jgi:hypothetical protein
MAILTDIAMSIQGEPSIDSNGDFRRVEGIDSLLQDCMFRLKTVIGDWVLMPDCGASLESLIGSANSPDTASSMEAMVREALTHDALLLPGELTLITIPVDINTILLTVIISRNGRQANLSVSLDLKEGSISLVSR